MEPENPYGDYRVPERRIEDRYPREPNRTSGCWWPVIALLVVVGGSIALVGVAALVDWLT